MFTGILETQTQRFQNTGPNNMRRNITLCIPSTSHSMGQDQTYISRWVCMSLINRKDNWRRVGTHPCTCYYTCNGTTAMLSDNYWDLNCSYMV